MCFAISSSFREKNVKLLSKKSELLSKTNATQAKITLLHV